MKKRKIVIDEKIPFLNGVFDRYAETLFLPGDKIRRKHVVDADALIVRTRTKCNRQLLEGTRVKCIATATIGFDHIDTDFCRKNNIFWNNAAGCNSGAVAQYIAVALLKTVEKFGFNLKDMTIGIVGLGNVGKKVEKIARLLGMKILCNDPPRKELEQIADFVSLSEILDKADIITLHVPLSQVGSHPTFHLANPVFFDAWKNKRLFLNTSRGEVVDTKALKKCISQTGLLSVIDVWENEPALDTELLRQTIIGTPHIAGYSADGKANGTAMSVETICRFFDFPNKNWYPKKLPEPENPRIVLHTKGKSIQKLVYEAVHHTYCIENDNDALKRQPSQFEKLRAEYIFRREFPAFNVQLSPQKEEAKSILHAIGFSI